MPITLPPREVIGMDFVTRLTAQASKIGTAKNISKCVSSLVEALSLLPMLS